MQRTQQQNDKAAFDPFYLVRPEDVLEGEALDEYYETELLGELVLSSNTPEELYQKMKAYGLTAEQKEKRRREEEEW